jgi:hypothetical protein
VVAPPRCRRQLVSPTFFQRTPRFSDFRAAVVLAVAGSSRSSSRPAVHVARTSRFPRVFTKDSKIDTVSRTVCWSTSAVFLGRASLLRTGHFSRFFTKNVKIFGSLIRVRRVVPHSPVSDSPNSLGARRQAPRRSLWPQHGWHTRIEAQTRAGIMLPCANWPALLHCTPRVPDCG